MKKDRIASVELLSAIFIIALSFPLHRSQGAEPHRPREVYIFASCHPLHSSLRKVFFNKMQKIEPDTIGFNSGSDNPPPPPQT